MHLVDAKGILSSRNGMNIYRGCTHGCIYCDSRSKCYHIDHTFEDVEVKQNAPELLEKALRSKRKKCMIGTGSMCDPYMPHEKELEIMRRCLEIIRDTVCGSVITKLDLILADLDLITIINEDSKSRPDDAHHFDDSLCRLIEPGVCTTGRRYEVLKKMQENNVLPWSDDSHFAIYRHRKNITGLLEMCADAGVRGIICFGMGLTLREGNREYFFLPWTGCPRPENATRGIGLA